MCNTFYMNNKSKKLIALVLLGVFAYISLNYLISKDNSKENELKEKEVLKLNERVYEILKTCLLLVQKSF